MWRIAHATCSCHLVVSSLFDGPQNAPIGRTIRQRERERNDERMKGTKEQRKKGRKEERKKGRKEERKKGRKEERKKGRKEERKKGRKEERKKGRKEEKKRGNPKGQGKAVRVAFNRPPLACWKATRWRLHSPYPMAAALHTKA